MCISKTPQALSLLQSKVRMGMRSLLMMLVSRLLQMKVFPDGTQTKRLRIE